MGLVCGFKHPDLARMATHSSVSDRTCLQLGLHLQLTFCMQPGTVIREYWALHAVTCLLVGDNSTLREGGYYGLARFCVY